MLVGTATHDADRTAAWWVAATLAALMFCYWTTLAQLVSQWWTNDVYSYGLLVPFISGYVAWAMAKDRRMPHLVADPAGFALLALGLGMLIVGQAGAVLALQEISFPISLTGLIVLLFGRRLLSVFWFPLLYLFLMIPVWDSALTPLHYPNQLLASSVAASILNAIGIPVFRSGTILALPNITLEVARVCSGVNYLIAVFAISLPVGYLFLRGYARPATLVVFSLGVACLGNGVRVALIGALSHYGVSGGNVHGPFHILNGLAVSGVGYMAIFFAVSILARRQQAPSAETEVDTLALPRPRLRPLMPFATAAVLCLVVVGAYPLIFGVVEVPLQQALASVPHKVENWEMDSTALPGGLSFRGVDEELDRVYQRGSGERLRLYVGYYRSQSQRKELVGEDSAALHTGALPVRVSGEGKDEVTVNHLPANNAGKQREMLFWYDINGKVTAGAFSAKAYTTWAALTRRNTNGAIIIVSWDPQPGGDSEASLNAKMTFVRALLPLLEKHLSI